MRRLKLHHQGNKSMNLCHLNVYGKQRKVKVEIMFVPQSPVFLSSTVRVKRPGGRLTAWRGRATGLWSSPRPSHDPPTLPGHGEPPVHVCWCTSETLTDSRQLLIIYVQLWDIFTGQLITDVIYEWKLVLNWSEMYIVKVNNCLLTSDGHVFLPADWCNFWNRHLKTSWTDF